MKVTTILGLLVVVAMTACGNNRTEEREENWVDSMSTPNYDTPVDTMRTDTVDSVIPPTPQPTTSVN